MKGNEKIVQTLNELLVNELTAINQYMVHAEICANWRYERLYEKIRNRAITEMKHAEMLIERVIFLEGMPLVSKLNEINIGPDVAVQFQNDLTAEQEAVRTYNEAIRLAADLGDNGTRTLVESILTDEEDHIDWLEAQLDQIKQIGIQNYLTEQTKA